MALDTRSRILAHLCQAGLTSARANDLLDAYADEIADRVDRRPPFGRSSHVPHVPAGFKDPQSLPAATGCEHWRREHKEDLCAMSYCERCRYLEKL